MALSKDELLRYSRHLNLPQFETETQEKLKSSKVLVVGAGGLGAPMLQYLTAAGVGTIGVLDFDVVDESNLQRQVLFDTRDLGKSKTSVAIGKLKNQNPNTHFIEFNQKLSSENALEILKDFDVVADGSDNFPTRYLVNDACVLLGKTNIYASIFQFEGQVSVFNYQDGPNYRDLYPTPPLPGMVPNCAEGGVLGVLAGIVGSIQAAEVIKVLTGIGNPLSGKLLLIDTLDFSFRKINIRKSAENPISGVNKSITKLIDYDKFCGFENPTNKAININQLKKWEQNGTPFRLIDVREEDEYKALNLGGISIPLSKIEDNLEQIPKTGDVIIHCKSGQRSAMAINLLMDKYGYDNLINLEGDIFI